MDNKNAIHVITPDKKNGVWAFDDASVGLVREPFVSGMPEILDYLVRNIPNADAGFGLLFSDREFPGYNMRLSKATTEAGGTWYITYIKHADGAIGIMQGWLCPALFLYYEAAPEQLYLQAQEM